MRALLALARAGLVLALVALLLAFAPAPRAASSAVEVVLQGPHVSRVLPLELARHLREAILDRTTLQRLADGEGSSDAARLEAVARLERGVEVVTVDGRVFHVVVSDSDTARATRVSDELAELVVVRASELGKRACADPGCSATARVAERASPVSLPMEPARWLALGFGLMLALAAGVVPLVASSPGVKAKKPWELDDIEEPPPQTDKIPLASRTPSQTLPLDPARFARTDPMVAGRSRHPTSVGPGPQRSTEQEPAPTHQTAPPVGPTDQAGPPVGPGPHRPTEQPPHRPTEQPPHRPTQTEQAPPPTQTAAPSPVMGYAAPPGWHADQTLNPGARSALAAELTRASGDECIAVAVSGGPNRLKATLATELALAASSSGDRRLLLVEADFRNPGIAALLHLEVPQTADFSSELERRAAGTPSESLSVLICTESLHVLPAAGSPSADLVLTTHFEACLKMMRDYYDLIVIHAPPTSAGVYCTAIADVVDAAVVVGEESSRVPAALLKKSLVRLVPA